jgi:hypothetical protein
MVLQTGNAAPAWTTVTDIANYAPLPPDVIRTFIERGAKRFERAGWAVIDRNNPGDWLDFFKTTYGASGERHYGAYDAYRLVPR